MSAGDGLLVIKQQAQDWVWGKFWVRHRIGYMYSIGLSMIYTKDLRIEFDRILSGRRDSGQVKGLGRISRSEEVGIYKRKQESKRKRRKLALDQESDKEND